MDPHPFTPADRIALGDTVFAAMTALATEHGAANLGQGFPDEDGPQEMLRIASDAILGGDNQYGPGRGSLELRRAIARDRARRYGTGTDPEREVLVTVGATEGIAASLLALVEPGREVVVLEPTYDAYRACIRLAGGVPRPVPLRRQGTRWSLDREAFDAAVGPTTGAVVLNSPHNPTGLVLGGEDLEFIAGVVGRHGTPVVSDEVYERLVLEGEHVPFATLPGMDGQTLTVSSAAKSFNVTGWKTGWVTGPAGMVDAVLAAKQFLTYVGATPLQPAVAWALDNADGWSREWLETLRARRDRLAGVLRSTGMEVMDAEGTYFLVSDVAPVLRRRPDLGSTARKFCLRLPEAVGVAAIPLSAFCEGPGSEEMDTLVRWTFCKDERTMETAQQTLLEGLGTV